MLNRLFGNYLVNKKCITQEQLDSILPVSKESKASVEVIAVILKYMSPVQVQSLLSKIDKNTTRFGEAAIEAGYISDERLDQILTYQGNAFMRFVQLLYVQDYITLESISQLLDDFKTENDRNDFIEMISDEIRIMESLVDELTETINKKILERLKH